MDEDVRVDYQPGELVIYTCGSRFEIGKVKRVNATGAFVYYHSGATAAHTPFENLHKLENAYTVTETILGKEDE